MDVGEQAELVHTLARRQDVLCALDGEPRHKPALAAELDVARSTVDRAIRQLESHGLVDREDDGLALTTTGELALDVYRDFASQLADVRGARDVLEDLPSREFVDPAFLRDATVVRASVSAPDRPVRAFVDIVREATAARGFSPTAYEAYVDAFERRIVDGEMTAELAFSEDALAELTTTHRDAIQRAVETGRVDVSLAADLPDAGLVLLTRADGSRVVAMGVHDGKGLGAVVTNDDPAALEWAQCVIDEQLERADAIPLGG